MSITSDLLVYVAGPYTKPDHLTNTQNSIRVGNDLLHLGYASVVPHLSYFWDMIFPHPYELWLAMDIEILRRCSVLLRLPGYSYGSDKEVEFARAHGIPVVLATSIETAAMELDMWAAQNV